MKLSRLSMFYLAGYLVPAGLMLLTMPRLVFVLFFSSQPDAYGDVMPRVAGALTLALGMLVVQMIRLPLLHCPRRDGGVRRPPDGGRPRPRRSATR